MSLPSRYESITFNVVAASTGMKAGFISLCFHGGHRRGEQQADCSQDVGEILTYGHLCDIQRAARTPLVGRLVVYS